MDLVLLFVDEYVNWMLVLHEMLLCRPRRPLVVVGLFARNTNLRLISSEISYAVVRSRGE
jgi:hypothetical protein